MAIAIIPTKMIHPAAPRVPKAKPSPSVTLPMKAFNVPTATAAAIIAPTANACVKEAKRVSHYKIHQGENPYNNSTPHSKRHNANGGHRPLACTGTWLRLHSENLRTGYNSAGKEAILNADSGASLLYKAGRTIFIAS